MKDKEISTSITHAAWIMVASVVLSRLVGLLRDMTITYYFKPGFELDAYTAAFKVPDCLMYLIAGGSLSSTFIPSFQKYLKAKDIRGAWETFSVVVSVTSLIAIALVVISELFTPKIIAILNPGYHVGTPEFHLAVRLARIVLPAQIFFLIGGLFIAAQNARKEFIIPALAPSIYNIGIILGAIVLVPRGLGVIGLALGALIGAFIGNFCLQLWALQRGGMQYRPLFSLLHPGAMEVWGVLLPVIFGIQFHNVDQIINTAFASKLAVGSQSTMQFANRIMLIPIGIFAQALAIAVFPSMSSLAVLGKKSEFRAIVNQALRLILFLTIPVSALLYILAVPIVTVLLQHGAFTRHDTEWTAMALRFFSLGIFAWSAQSIIIRGFLAIKDSLTFVVASTVGTVFFILMEWVIVHYTSWGIAGLTIATSVTVVLLMIVTLELLRRRLHGILGPILINSFLKTCLATVALCIVTSAAKNQMASWAMSPLMHAATITLLSTIIGVTIFLAAARALKMPEYVSVVGMVLRLVSKGTHGPLKA